MMRFLHIIFTVVCFALFVEILQVRASWGVLHDQEFQRLETIQDIQAGTLDTSSNPESLVINPAFWKSGSMFLSDDFYPINASTGKSAFPSALTGEFIRISAQGCESNPSRRMVIDYRRKYVFSVCRSYKIGGHKYEFFAETDVTGVYARAAHLLCFHVLAILMNIIAVVVVYKFVKMYESESNAVKKRFATAKVYAGDNDLDIYVEFFKNCPDGVILIEMNGQIRDANKQLSDMLGYTIEQLKTMHVNDLMNEKYRAGHMSLVSDFLENSQVGMTKAREVEAQCKDGRTVPIRLSVGILRSIDFTGAVTVVGAGLTSELKT